MTADTNRVTTIRAALLDRYAREEFGQDTALLEQELTAILGAEDAEAVMMDLAEEANEFDPEDL